MIAREEHLGYGDAAKDGRPRKCRMIERVHAGGE
jgi:hypothetical protein